MKLGFQEVRAVDMFLEIVGKDAAART